LVDVLTAEHATADILFDMKIKLQKSPKYRMSAPASSSLVTVAGRHWVHRKRLILGQ